MSKLDDLIKQQKEYETLLLKYRAEVAAMEPKDYIVKFEYSDSFRGHGEVRFASLEKRLTISEGGTDHVSFGINGTRKLIEVLTDLCGDNAEAGASIAPRTGETYTGERRDLQILLGCGDWVSTAHAVSAEAKRGTGIIRPGDYFRIPVKAEAASIGGLDFKALDIPETELVAVQISEGGVIFNFDEVLFCSAVNAADTNKGGFKDSDLSQYLNGPFLAALDPIRGILAKNRDGKFVTLPTFYEVFGDGKYGKDVNWEEEPRQLEYFKSIRNRIRVEDNDTMWWWLSTAVNATGFSTVSGNGGSGNNSASRAGGVAPAIRVS
jgi:hypothetical protein